MTDTRIPIQSEASSPLAAWDHLIPIVQALIDAGHQPIKNEEQYGFVEAPHEWKCELYDPITLDDWQMLNEKFIIPENIFYTHGMVRDGAGWVDIYGVPRDAVEYAE